MEAKTVVIGVLVGLVVFAIFIGIIATEMLEGPAPKENSYATLALRQIDGEVKAVGISGVLGTNPTIIMRSSPDHQMNLRIINQDHEPHQFVIEGLASTRILDTDNVVDTLVLSGGNEGSYTYKCALHDETFGEFRIVRVTARG